MNHHIDAAQTRDPMIERLLGDGVIGRHHKTVVASSPRLRLVTERIQIGHQSPPDKSVSSGDNAAKHDQKYRSDCSAASARSGGNSAFPRGWILLTTAGDGNYCATR